MKRLITSAFLAAIVAVGGLVLSAPAPAEAKG